MFVANALDESTRRGARLAAVCPVGDPAPAQAAILAGTDGVSAIAQDLTTANVTIAYLDVNGAPVANPALNLAAIRYVRTSIVNYRAADVHPTHHALVPHAFVRSNAAGRKPRLWTHTPGLRPVLIPFTAKRQAP